MLTDRSGRGRGRVGARSGRAAGRGRQRAHLHARGWQSRKAPTHPVPVQKLHQRRLQTQSSPGQYAWASPRACMCPCACLTACTCPSLLGCRLAACRLPGQAGQPGNYQHSHETRELTGARTRTHPAWVSLSVQARAYVNFVLPIQLRGACMRRTSKAYMRAHRPPNRNTPTPHPKRNRNQTIRPACT